MSTHHLSPDELRALEAMSKDLSIARLMAPQFTSRLEKLGLVERRSHGVGISPEGRRRVQAVGRPFQSMR